jgi:hypothetical protein
MKPEVVTAIIAAIVAVISAIVSIYGHMRVTQLSDRLAKQREAASREAQTSALMSKYRDPLLRSATTQAKTPDFPLACVTVAKRENQGFSSSPFGYIVQLQSSGFLAWTMCQLLFDSLCF